MTAELGPMRDRRPAQSVIEELIRHQLSRPQRSRLARVLGMSPLDERARAWYLGAIGELLIGELLARLPERWTVFHALPVGRNSTDIDHVVVGPGGVFTINTKHHEGQNIWVAGRTFMIAGTRHPYIPKAEGEADGVMRLLGKALGPVPVTPMIVVVNPKQVTVREAPARVRVLTNRQLLGWLKKRPTTLDGEWQARVVAVLDDPRSWRPVAPPPADLAEQFGRLVSSVRGARAIRVLWALAGFGAAATAALTALAHVM